jgi:hypothetical protein
MTLVAGGGLAALLGIGLGATPAHAEAPSQQGWWSSANQGSVEGLPTAAPAPPDVPAKGLLIQGGSGSTSGASDSGALAYAALSYVLPSTGTAGTLTLMVAPNSATTPISTLELCPLVNPYFLAQQDGPTTSAPAYACKNNVTAKASSNGTSYQFKVASLVEGGGLAVAILPTSPSDRVVFSQPDANSLSIDQPSVPTGNSGAAPPSTTTTSVTLPPTTTSLPAVPITGNTGNTGFTVPAGSSFSPPTAAPASPQTPVPQASGTAAASVPFNSSVPTVPAANALTVALILTGLILGGIVWMAVGRAAVRAATKDGIGLATGELAPGP